MKRTRGDEGVAVVSTGSTLLDLAISGGVRPEGGIPGGILCEIFGPSGCGKTTLLCELAGAILRQQGRVKFSDPEGRLNNQFARLFGLDIDRDEVDYERIATVVETFESIRDWAPKDGDMVHGAFVDSLAALTTDMELGSKDKYGMRRAKEFSEQCRLTCRHIAETNLLVVLSNQVRQNLDAGPYGQKYKTPGGESIGFYSSLRLRCKSARKIFKKVRIRGKDDRRIVGVQTEIEVFKSSIWKPYRSAMVNLIFDYGIDDIRSNLDYLKRYTSATTYKLGDHRLGRSMDRAAVRVEKNKLEQELRASVIALWNEVEAKFEVERQPKRRF